MEIFRVDFIEMEWKEVGEKNKIDRAAFRTTHKQHMNPINEYLDEGKKREEKKSYLDDAGKKRRNLI